LDVEHRRWATERDARRDVFRWIAFYSHRRRHSALSHLSHADYEQTLAPTTLHQIAAQSGVDLPVELQRRRNSTVRA
jgi:hypothetical protein